MEPAENAESAAKPHEGTAQFDRARRLHEESAARHDAVALQWDRRGQPELAEFERRCARLERRAAQLDADRAAVARSQARLGLHDAAGRAEIARLTSDIRHRAAKLRADDDALERKRPGLQRQSGPVNERRLSQARRARADADAADDTGRAARHLSLILNQIAADLEEAAAAADERAWTKHQIGHVAAAAADSHAAERARQAARRARSQAREWLGLSVDHEP